MKRLGAIFTVLAAVVMLTVSSCKETKEFDDHANWKKRNADFISDRASDCGNEMPETAVKGSRFRLLSFRLDPEKSWSKTDYVYCEVLEQGTWTDTPYYTDSVRFEIIQPINFSSDPNRLLP